MSRKPLILIVLVLVAAACGTAGGPEDAESPPDTTADASAEGQASSADDDAAPAAEAGLTGEVDITDAILTNTAADCGAYDVILSASASDLTRDLLFESGVTIEVDGSTCLLSSNGIPNHDFNDNTASFATDVAQVNRTFTITRQPERAETPTAIEQGSFDGVLLNGVVIDVLSAGCYRPDDPAADADGNILIGCAADSPWLTNPLGTDHKFGADSHNAHTQPDGTYHYHGNPIALFDDNPTESGSPLIGWAADGFPIYGSYFVDPETGDIRKAVSGYELKQGDRPAGEENPPGAHDGTYYDDYDFTGAGDLDECNGMELDGQYGYYVTDEYPYLPICFTGTPDPSFDKGAGEELDGAQPDPGVEPDLADAAAALGVTVEELQAALGPPPPDLEAAAATLGVSIERLEEVLPAP